MTTVTTGTKKVDAFRALFCVLALFSLPSVLTDVEGTADIVLAEAVTEADATVLEGTGTERVVSDLANTAMPLTLLSTEE